MTITFKYKVVNRANGSKAFSPSIPITVCGNKNTIDTTALLDTGADTSVISKAFAELLGLNLKMPAETTTGIGGNVPAKRTKAVIMIQKGHEKYHITVPILVLLEEKENIEIILGRQVFFDEFSITFDQKNNKISLKKNT